MEATRLRIGKHDYILGLAWQAADGVSPAEIVRDASEDAPAAFLVLKARKRKGREAPPPVVGYARPGVVKRGERVRSFAAACAQAGAGDAIYAMVLPDGKAWYAACLDGQVLADTDHVLPVDDLPGVLGTLRGLFRDAAGNPLPLRAPPGVARFIAAEDGFDPEAVASGDKSPALAFGAGAGKAIVGLAIIVAVLAVAGFLGWKLLHAGTPSEAEQEAQMQREAYLAALVEAVGKLPQPRPEAAAWPAAALRATLAEFPPVLYGWRQDGVNCDPSGCAANYSLPGAASPFLLSPIIARYGEKRVKLGRDGRSLSVRSAWKPGLRMQQADESWLYAPPKGGVVLDAYGRLAMRYGAQIAPEPLRSQVVGGPAPADVAPAAIEIAAIKGNVAPDPADVRWVADLLLAAGLVPTKLSYSNGGTIKSQWRLETSRVVAAQSQSGEAGQ